MKKTPAVAVWIVNIGKVINTRRKVGKSYSIETALHMITDIVSNEAAQTFASRDP